MLKRIAVLDPNHTLYPKAVKAAASREDVQVVAVSSPAGIPPATAALVAGASQMAHAMEGAITLAAWNEQTLYFLAEALDCRESLMPGSSKRVMDHAARFAQTLGLDAGTRLTVARGALLRDIGKVKIANAVLLKEGILTYDEWNLIHEHPHLGAELAAQCEALRDIAEIVKNHHESYDGDGYPDGLEGETIPYAARLVRVVDVYCAMTSPRLYRKGHSSHEEAIDHLRDERGKHFDPALVDAFVDAKIGQTL